MSDYWLNRQVDKFAFDFDEADKDKNGTLTCDEVVAILRKAGFEGTDEEGKDIFEHLDMNKDNKITKDEFKDAIWRMPKFSIVELNLRKAFQAMDTDKSGSVTKKELLVYFEKDKGDHIEEESVKKIFKYLEETDDDGQVHYEEFLKQMEFDETKSVMHKIFSAIDKDGSGTVSVQELKDAVQAQGQLRKLRRQIQSVLNFHKDEKIDFHQFLVLWNKK